ncbi:MAG: hypothetical protein JWP74_949 [Marmoricola sp.]|nr:hypothetical protein [Marmoricola sp.]
MAGNHRAHRAPSGSRLPRRAIVVAVVIALVPALVLGGRHLLGGSSGDAPRRPASSQLPIPAVSPSATAPVSPSPTATSTKKVGPKSPTRPATKVKPDVPRRLTVPGVLDVGFDDSVQPKNGLFTAASTAEVARWGTRGSPGSPGSDTVYVVGKIDGSKSAFRTLAQVHTGSRISIRTDSGTLTYTVTSVGSHRASTLTHDASFRARHPGRLYLIGLRYTKSGSREATVLLVTAELSGARKT